jgi:rod shape-determining protein MreC
MALKKNFIVFICIILFIFALLTYQGVRKDKDLIPDLPLYPLMLMEKGISYIKKSISQIFKTYVLITGKERENKILLERIRKLEEEKNQYRESVLENERLRKILELKSKKPEYITTAGIFARDQADWFRSLWINKGENEGIEKDMIAITPLGIIGRIQRILGNRANVILVTNINSSVAVRIQSTRAEGILVGRGDDKCYLKYIPQDVKVAVGDAIITSGLDGIYPKGLLAGHVTQVTREQGEMFSVIEVATAQDLNALDEAVILRR